MSVDKFDSYSRRKEKNLRGPTGKGFNLTLEFNYDIQKKRLTNVHDLKEDPNAIILSTNVTAVKDVST